MVHHLIPKLNRPLAFSGTHSTNDTYVYMNVWFSLPHWIPHDEWRVVQVTNTHKLTSLPPLPIYVNICSPPFSLSFLWELAHTPLSIRVVYPKYSHTQYLTKSLGYRYLRYPYLTTQLGHSLNIYLPTTQPLVWVVSVRIGKLN